MPLDLHGPGRLSPPDAAALRQRLHAGPGDWVALEDFAPLPQCLEWRLSRAYWDQRGAGAFFGGEVPYAAINDGRLSCDTARLLVEMCEGDAQRAPRVLEVGGGSGLFARLFLDELKALAPALHAATTYVWTDGSPAMVQQAQTQQMFAGHEGQVRCRTTTLPAMGELGDPADGGYDLIIANYAIDNLPATMLRLGADGIEEMQVRATLPSDLNPQRLGGRSAAEWAEGLRRGSVAEAEAIDLYPWFSLDCRYVGRERGDFAMGAAIGTPPAGSTWHWLHHDAAWQWLAAALPRLRPGGAVLINDYGYRASTGGPRHDAFQHFGPSLANGLNLDELERVVAALDGHALAAPATDSRQVASRLIAGRGDALTAGIFKLIFDGQRRDHALDLVDRADAAAAARRLEEARWLYWQAREAAPRCWHVLERWGRFCLNSLKDPTAAAGLAREGLGLHPRHPGLWNLLGDARYEAGVGAAERSAADEAEQAYRQALSAAPRDWRARLNLAFVMQDRGCYGQALALLAEALALDPQGEHRDALLEKQRQVLLAQTLEQRDALVAQMNRFRNLDAPAP